MARSAGRLVSVPSRVDRRCGPGRIDGPPEVGRDLPRTLALQRQIGNRAVARALQNGMTDQPVVQRCGAEQHPGCPCVETLPKAPSERIPAQVEWNSRHPVELAGRRDFAPMVVQREAEDCTYRPGEKEASAASDGGVEKVSDREFLLTDFTPGKIDLKRGHQTFLPKLFADLHLSSPLGSDRLDAAGSTDCVSENGAIDNKLRHARAASAASFMSALGAKSDRIGIAMASAKVASNASVAGRARNRHVRLVVSKLAPTPSGPGPHPGGQSPQVPNGSALIPTLPAIVTPGPNVDKPDARIIPGLIGPAPEPEREYANQITFKVDMAIDLVDAKFGLKVGDKPDESSPVICENVGGSIGLAGVINTKKRDLLGKELTLFPSYEFSMNGFPMLCGKKPGIEASLDLLKVRMAEAVELSLAAALEPLSDGEHRGGWLLTAPEITFSLKPSDRSPISLEIGGKLALTLAPGAPLIDAYTIQGFMAIRFEMGSSSSKIR